MRRMHVVPVVVLMVGLWPAGPSLAEESSAEPVVVRADFNDDGAEDLAVGVPGEALGTVPAAGAVNVLYGTPDGLAGSGSQLFTQDTPGIGGTAEPGDSFGGALATGDFDGDGFTDLAVGVPGEALGTVPAAGAVNVLYGTPDGLAGSGSQLFTQDTPGVGGTADEFDSFGAALAAGDLNGDDRADLAVGAPFERIGAVFDAGAVNVLYGAASGLSGTGSRVFTQDTPGVGGMVEPTDRFGAALTIGDFDDDDFSDLAVGAPLETVGTGPTDGAGAVNVLFGSATGLQGSGGQLFTQDTTGVPGAAEAFDNFGSTLAAGDFDGDAAEDLAIAVPNEGLGAAGAAGAVHVLYGSTQKLQASGSQLFTQDTAGVGGISEQNDDFGTGLASGDFDNDGFTDLAVGAPGETLGTVTAAGAVNVLYGSASRLTGTGSQLFTQDTPGIGDTAEDVDLFGWQLAAGDFDDDGSADLAVGVPAEDVGAAVDGGAVNVLRGSAAAGLAGAGSQLFTQNAPGIGGTAEELDSFGAVLAVAEAS